jgi:hypothetical protein
VLGAGAGGQTPAAAAAAAAINALLSGNGSATGSEVYQLLAAAQAAGLAPSGSAQAAAGGGGGGVSPPPGTWRHLMTPGERAEKLQRYRTKKQARNFDKVRLEQGWSNFECCLEWGQWCWACRLSLGAHLWLYVYPHMTLHQPLLPHVLRVRTSVG